MPSKCVRTFAIQKVTEGNYQELQIGGIEDFSVEEIYEIIKLLERTAFQFALMRKDLMNNLKEGDKLNVK